MTSKTFRTMREDFNESSLREIEAAARKRAQWLAKMNGDPFEYMRFQYLANAIADIYRD